MPLRLWVICFVPVIAVVWGCVMLYKSRHAKRPQLASAIALTLCTASAMLAACGTVYLTYFACIPSSTPWTALPEYTLDFYVMLLAFSSGVAGLIALTRGHSRGLNGTVLLTSGWLLLFSFVHASTI
jgi:hypothetical protein